MSDTIRRVLVGTLIVVGVVVAVLALWELRLLIALGRRHPPFGGSPGDRVEAGSARRARAVAA